MLINSQSVLLGEIERDGSTPAPTTREREQLCELLAAFTPSEVQHDDIDR